MAGKIISFVNLKGGVGKTSLTVNVGVSLAAQLGKNVLVIDLDPQSNASMWLMGLGPWVERAKYQFTKTVFGLLCHNEPLAECIVKSPVKNETGMAEVPRLDLMPATYNLLTFEERDLRREGRPPWYVHFYRHVKTLKDSHYDYILLDCPPNTYKTTKCAVFASDHIIVPCNPDALSWLGLELLSKIISQFSHRTTAEFNHERPGAPLPLVSAIVMNDLNAAERNVNRQGITNLEHTLSRLRIRGLAREDAEIIPIRIRGAAALKRGTFQFKPLLFATPRNENLLEDYQNLATYFINRL